MNTVTSTLPLAGRKDMCVGLDHFVGNRMKNAQQFMRTEDFQVKKTGQYNVTA